MKPLKILAVVSALALPWLVFAVMRTESPAAAPSGEVSNVSARVALALAQAAPRPPQAILPAGCPCGCSCRNCVCVLPGACGDPACDCGGRQGAKKPPACQCFDDCDCQLGQRGEDCACGGGCPCARLSGRKALTLAEAIDKAVRQDKPLLVWVREVCPPCEHAMPDYIHVHVSRYEGTNDVVTKCGVIVGKPDGQGSIDRLATLPGFPTAEQVAAVLAPKATPTMYYRPAPVMMMPMMGFGGGCRAGG